MHNRGVVHWEGQLGFGEGWGGVTVGFCGGGGVGCIHGASRGEDVGSGDSLGGGEVNASRCDCLWLLMKVVRFHLE